jgi:AcrR family transcriptional regulator
LKVPLATVASAAGVGILYQHFPSRAALLDGLVVQSLRLVVDDIRAAAGDADTAIEAVRGPAAVGGRFVRTYSSV